MPQVSKPVAPARTHWGCPHNAHPLFCRSYSRPGLSQQGSQIGSCLGTHCLARALGRGAAAPCQAVPAASLHGGGSTAV